MTDQQAGFSFKRHNRNNRTVAILICIYACLAGLVIFLDAALWIVILLVLATLPALWDVFHDTTAGVSMGASELRWHSGSREGRVKLSEVEKFRFDTRWDFSVRVSALLKSGKRLRLPTESLPPHRELETLLQDAGFTVERHHFRVF